jgi:HPt (histidine-containing phosphotransfer) domain-containing protein
MADAPAHLRRIGAAHATHDLQVLAESAHALKGSASNVGATALASLASELEFQAKAGRLDADPGLQPRLERSWADTRAKLQAWLG